MTVRLLGPCLLALPLACAVGCNGGAQDVGDRPYIPPDETLALPELIDELNASREQIESLFLQGTTGDLRGFEANLRESRGEPARFVNGDITAMYLAPDRLRLKANKAGVGDVLDLGTNGDRFWLYLPTEGVLYYGTYAGIDPQAARQMPVRPDLIMQVIGVAPLDRDLIQSPVPMLRYNPDADAYMLTWAELIDGPPARWAVQREVWYDRETLLPTLVILFNEDGDPVLRAYLSNHENIGDSDLRIASRYDLYFPETGSTMWLDFGDLNFRNPRNSRFPLPGSFNPPDPGDVPNPVPLDRADRRRQQAGL